MMTYRIRVQSLLDDSWQSWLADTRVAHDHAKQETVMTCTVVDQAQLQGILRKLHSLGLILVSVQLLEA